MQESAGLAHVPCTVKWDSFAGTGGFSFKMAHSHVWHIGVGGLSFSLWVSPQGVHVSSQHNA